MRAERIRQVAISGVRCYNDSTHKGGTPHERFQTSPKPPAPVGKDPVLIAAVFCVVTVVAIIDSRQTVPEEPQPPKVSDEAPLPSDTVSVTEPPYVETTAQPAETTVPPTTEPSIQDSAAYQKLLTVENADQFDEAVLEAFAHWIEGEEDFLETYPEKWEMEELYNGTVSLTCYTPLTEDYKRTLCSLYYDGEKVFINTIIERGYTSVPREEVSAKVYGAEDPIGVPDELKEEFIDFIMDSDWFAASTLWPDYRTEWYFEMEPIPGSGDQTGYITLFVKVWSPDDGEDDYALCSLYYDGEEVRDGRRS